ncbi:MAG TPA: amino acid adenylation domain-containing protein [Longimicrobiaceae bacterium]|nr:amino acid adenylation domain-containing protein [Longimicrobiaceae bacterium]
MEVAIVSMAGRFPGADDVEAFWRNLRGGVESISFFTREELLAAGADAGLLDRPDFVPAGGVLGGADELDAGLFQLTPRDAEILNPQHRVLLECAWEALERAGYDPARVERPVGVFAGCSANDYVSNLLSAPELVSAVGTTRISLGNARDHLAGGISYRLNLQGPSVVVQTACSTSLVAVHLACQSLLGGECDMALAGGVSIPVPLRQGYLYTPDGIVSPDGHCRAFDADARGTVGGSGAGLVLLKRLDDALADGDTIRAVIRGSAVNNDGAQKVGYTAPSVTGQARVLSEALSMAGVDPATVQYVETHGSGTPLGDAIELQAMSQALSRGEPGHRCAIGSVKPNIGHLDAAAGVAGLIKAVLALEHREIPPSLNCAVPHPEIEAAGGRVFVNTALTPWERNGAPRRAGVSSFGIGGTNAHVVLEEAPPAEPSGPSSELQLLVLSARTPSALARAAENLADLLEREAPPLADVAFTLRTGRREMEHRLAVVCRDAAEATIRLRETAARGSSGVRRTSRPVAFMFPGVGTHHVDMGRGLYDAEPVFRAAVDECCELLRPVLGSDLREVLYSAAPPGGEPGGADGWDLRRLLDREGGDAIRPASPLDETRFAQPAVLVTEYATARLWAAWGVRPRGLVGHSLGEYVAACVAGVLRLEDALRLVALRASLLDALPAGAMLAVPMSEASLRAVLPPGLDLAAVNTPESCVVAGSVDEVEAFAAVLSGRGTVSRRLPTRHAFHSRAMRGVAAELERLASGFELRPPEIPFVSGVTGAWITDEDACSPAYWARHLCRTVRFADGVATLRAEPGWVLLEVGPGQALGAWAMQHPAGGTPEGRAVFSSLRHQHNRVPDLHFALETLGGVWAAGAEVDWTGFGRGERRRRVPLPGYPFERRRYWVDPTRPNGAGEGSEAGATTAGQAGDAAGVPHEKGPDAMENQLPAQALATAPSPRQGAVLDLLKRVAAELTGIEERHVETDADFFQAGFDSLLLLQAIQMIEKRVGVRVSLVELLEEITTLGALAEHIDRALPPGAMVQGSGPTVPAGAEAVVAAAPAAVAEPLRTVPAPPAFYPASAGPALPSAGGGGDAGVGTLERVIAQQLQAMTQVMAQQIAAVRGDASSPPAGAGPSSPAPVPLPVDDGSGSAAGARSREVPRSPRAKIQPETFVAYQPLNTEGSGGLTPGQKEYLDDFIARYVERTPASKAHQARYHLPLADSRVTARFRRAWKEILYPIVSPRARGSRVWDLDGNEYVDIGMGFGCILFGHAPGFITRAIHEQAERGYGLGPQSPDAGRAAELVCELGGVDRAIFCNSGTEAVMGAIRAARAYTGRRKIAYFAGSYHGWSDAVLGRLFTVGGRREVRPAAPGVPALPLGDVLMLDFDEPSSLELLARHLDEIALVMVEPVQSRRPDMKAFAFVRELRRMTREAGALLLFDELITGFRLGPGGAQAYFGVDADLVTYGKIVAGGLPMGVVAGTREAMSVFDGGLWSYGDDSYPTGQRTLFAGAYFKHPLSMGVACAILEEIRRQGQPMYDRLNERTGRLVERINAFFEAGRFPITATSISSCFRFYFGPEVRFPDLFNHHMILEGVHVIPETGTHFLSAAHDDDDLERIFEAVRASAEAMRRGGFIPEPAGGAPASASGPATEPCPCRRVRDDGVRDDGVRVMALTEGQRQLWFESQMGDDAARAYTESTTAHLRGALDVGAMRAALQGLVDRHDTLRTTFGPEGDVQLVHPALELEVPFEDFRGVPAGERSARVEEWLRETVRRPFDLVRGPLVRFALAAVSDDEHLLVKDAHHAVLDGWSFGLVWHELGALYAAAKEGRRAELPPRRDHAELVRAQIEAVREDPAAEAFWLAEFADGVPVLDLPTDRPRPPVRSYRGERMVRVMDGELLHRLSAAGRPHGLTMFNTLFSAFFLWLSRLSGQDDLVVGTPSAGQAGTAGMAELVGYGINVLPVRARLDASASFVDHARQVRRSVLRALDHQNYSFPQLVEKLLRTRDPSRPPVFAAMMNLDRVGGEEALGDLRVRFEGNFGGGSKLDLTFGFTETPDALRLRCDFCTDLFDHGTIERWLACFERLLDQVARDPGVRLWEVDLVGPEERLLVLEEWNRTARPVPDTCLHRLFEAQAARTPHDPAVIFGEASITYAELDRRANRVAHALRRRGVGPDVRVALFLEHGPELVAAVLGVLKAGGAYVPLDPASPADRLASLLEDSGALLVLADDAAALPASAPPVLAAGAEAFVGEPDHAPDCEVHPHNLVYVIYTSGSTGRPKGVGVEHRSACNVVVNYLGGYDVGPGARLLSVSPLHFDMSVTDVFVALCSGAALVMAPRDELLPGPGLLELLRSQRVTHAKFTPSALAALPPADLPELRAITTGGEASTAELAARWAPGRRYFSGYGPTEATVRATVAECTDVTRTPPLGRPVGNVRVYVLDERQRPVPRGVAGELYIGGVQVARGYLGRPDLTAARFVPDPFGPEPGGRLYRTGDRVRWAPDGELVFIGRVDFQVKIRGHRVEPGEVEAVLLEHPGLAEAVVVALGDGAGGARLVGYVVPASGVEVSSSELREHARARLPDYMVPAAFVTLERLPLASNGKLDRGALPAPAFGAERETYAAPRTPAEEILAGIFAEVLKVSRVGAHDDFFSLGGHSLLAIRLISRVRDAFGVELPLRGLFEGPTVADLARRVEGLRRAGTAQLPPVVPVARGQAPPLSFAQERLWFLDRLQPESAFYNVPHALRFSGALDHAALERALGEIVRRHESLRTAFPQVAGEPVQEIAPYDGFTLAVEDLSALDGAEREAQAGRLASEEAARPFDLARGPVFRARLLRLGEEDHVLLLCMHHIVSDEWSMGVFFGELSALYEAYREGGDSPLPELPVQYADYSAWQREQLSGERLEGLLSYWRARLAGVPALLELPTDRPRPPVQSYRGAYEGVALPGALVEPLRALAGSEGATLHMVLLAAFQVLLSRYSGSEDVVVGTTIAGRSRREVEPLIGFFVNTLALRTDLSGDPSFREVVRRVREVTLGAYEHQEVPFEAVVADLRPERSLSHSPLVQVLFELHVHPAEEDLRGLSMRDVDLQIDTTKFDLSLELGARADGVFGAMMYSVDLFERSTIRRMIAHLQRVLEQVAGDPGARISRLTLAGAEERARVVEEWNRTDHPFPRDACIHELFEAQVERTPEALALEWGDQVLTYRELDARANRLAHHLAGLGVGPEDRVGVLLERSPEMVVATLAVMKAGGCCVPVDTTYPPERVELMLADSAVRVLLSQGDLGAPLAGAGVRVVRLDTPPELLSSGPADPPRSGVAPRNLAYVFYTSGSTGRPKGVMMAHREVVQFAACIPETMPMGPGDRVTQASNASFDAAVFEVWGALLNGAALVGIDRDVLLSAAALAKALREQRITHLYQTAALFNQHVREQVDAYSGLRQLVFGAEAVGTEGVRRMLLQGRPKRVLHEYGPTEATVWCTLDVVEEVAEGAATVPIGRPVPNARAYVLGPDLEPQPAGVPGELYVGGAGVVRGYLGRPDLTAGRFVPDPFAPEPGARMYRTGDRVRWRPDGRLEFMGRLDDQVKMRGFRIEPGEVEGALSAHPGVRQARVIVREDRPGEKRLVAYVVGTAGADALRAHLRRSLPEYMVPQAFVALDRLPLTPNGKLDRKALPAPDPASAQDRYAAPRSPVEEVLAEIWAEVLERKRVGVEENFFDLGGHSLLATRLVSRVRQAFGVELPVRALFEGPTVAEVSKRVEALKRAALPQRAPVLPVQRTGAPPLSFAQERLWFLDRLQQGGNSYNVSQALRLSGGADEAALERALGEVVRRHETLRTTFTEVDGVPAQVIAPFTGFVLPVEDLSAQGEPEREAAARQRAAEDAALPFDLTAGPLLRARLLRLMTDEHVLLLAMHHIVCDGWSMQVLFRELWTLYEAYRDGRESPLPELPVQYADYAVWQREQLGGEAELRQLAYWRERLAGAPELLELPTDHPRPPVPSFRGASVPVSVPVEVMDRLRELARREGTTLYVVALAAFQVLLSRYSGSEDVMVGTPIAGRTRQEVEELIGLFMNTLVLRADLAGNPSFRELVRGVRESVLGAYEHQEVPFERVVAEVQPERSLSRSTLFQVMFQLDNAEASAPGTGGLAVRGVEVEREATKFDLTLVLYAHPRGITGALQYSTDLFGHGTARRMVQHLERVLEQVGDDPDRRLSRLQLMGRAERARVLGWNRTEAKYPADRCIHQLFEAQAERTPDAVALAFEGRTLTFRDLDVRANRLAHHLAGRGVGPEVRVGICMERGPELMVAILGVMKAGGAYVPLDPSFPAERMSYLLADSGVAVLLTHARVQDRLPPGGGVEVLAIDREWERIAAERADPPESGVTSENLAYVIYTSGSTGLPKGVAMHHRGVCNYIHWGVRAYGADQGTGAPVFTSMAVDLTVTNLLPLFAGHPVSLLPEESPVEALAQVLREQPGFGLIKITPIHLGLLNSMLAPGDLPAAAHTLVVGADFLSAEPTVPWQEHAPGVRLMNEYGPTETVVGCSAYVLPAGKHRAGPVPVGRPIQNITFHVLDAHLEPVPVGLPGELYIGGAGVARGYLGRPELSAEKFVPDPFADPGARMYRSGDRARWLADGNLLILGRTDAQVKIRGYRVELGEVEAVLRQRPEVRECVAVVREDRPGDRRLVAYVVADASAADPAELREHLRRSVPEYMVPSAIVVLDSLPQTATGKLDRKVLPAPKYPGADLEFDEPESYVEVQLIQLWEELLGVQGIGARQSFFDLGGNSFLALRLFAQVNRRFHCDLPVATLFAGATVRQMAHAILEQRSATAAPPSSLVPLQPNGDLPPLFVIHSSDRNVMGYVNLVRHLGAEQPVYGLRDVGEDLARPITRIAAEHVAAVRSLQPRGPYYLAGWSFGGFVAYEMAVQLEREGETVAFVGLLDTMSTALAQEWPWQGDADLTSTLAHEIAEQTRRPFTLRPEDLQGLEPDEQVRRAVEALREQGAVPSGFEAAVLRDACRTVRDRNRSYAGYVPGRFSGTLTLFRASCLSPRHEEFFAPLGDDDRQTLGWSRHADAPVEVHPVPGTHATVAAEPHVRVLARHVRESLSAARERAARQPSTAVRP